ncbi:MAG: sulfite reductase subunit alpha [Chthoniobacterales bacterium]
MSTESTSGFSRKNPFPAKLTVNRKITQGGSEKDTRHFEICLKGSGLQYEVGDSLGIFPSNEPELVEELLSTLGFSGDESVPGNAGTPMPIRQALLTDYVITDPSKQLLQAIAEKDSSAEFLKDLIDPAAKTSLDQYVWGRDVLDPLKEFTAARFTPEEFVKVLRKLQPRLYSIASSLKVHPEQVHLTVACVRYESYNRKRKGVCSTFLAERVGETSHVPVFTHTAKHFRVPENTEAAMIMVGPGTGIAPFRAFLQERKATGAKGKNWLFFGEQRSSSDFFYREEFEALQADGVLTRFDTAFSRDQDFKIYVQHRLVENGPEIWKWLEEGAYFYVCGDAARMAKDVDTALHEIVEKCGGKTPEQAKEYIDAFKKEKRYRKDVY